MFTEIVNIKETQNDKQLKARPIDQVLTSYFVWIPIVRTIFIIGLWNFA